MNDEEFVRRFYYDLVFEYMPTSDAEGIVVLRGTTKYNERVTLYRKEYYGPESAKDHIEKTAWRFLADEIAKRDVSWPTTCALI